MENTHLVSPRERNFSEIITLIKIHLGSKEHKVYNKDVGVALQMTEGEMATAKSRNSIPYKNILLYGIKNNQNVQRLFYEYGNDLNISENTFSEIKNNLSWYGYLEATKKFYLINKRFPYSEEKYDDVDIGEWLDNLIVKQVKNINRDSYMILVNEIVSISDALDQKEKNTESKFDVNFLKLKIYFSMHGNIPKEQEIFMDSAISNWLNYQRKLFRKNKLENKKKNILLSISEKIFLTRGDILWEDNYKDCFNLLLGVNSDYREEQINDIYLWILTQRSLNYKGLLNAIRQERLLLINDSILSRGIDIAELIKSRKYKNRKSHE